jgi:hypothetical protein
MTNATAHRPGGKSAPAHPADQDDAGESPDRGATSRGDQLDQREAALAQRENDLRAREQGGTAAGRAQLAAERAAAEAGDDGKRRWTLTLDDADGTEVESDTGDSYTLVLANGERVHMDTLVSTAHTGADGITVPVVSAYADQVKSRRDNTAT